MSQMTAYPRLMQAAKELDAGRLPQAKALLTQVLGKTPGD